MTNEEFTTEIRTNWLDTNGLVKSQPWYITQGNGILHSCVANFLSGNWIVLEETFAKCFKKPGLMMRNPQNTFGQEEFDDLLTFSVYLLSIKGQRKAKDICWYGVKHLGFYLNVPFTWSDFRNSFLWRFPQVWVLMWCAAYPGLKCPLYPFMKLIGLFMKLDPNTPDGVQLSWLYFEGMNLLGFHTKQLDKARLMMPDACKKYYASNHAITQFVTDKFST